MQEVKCPVCKGKGEYDVHSDAFNVDYTVNCSICAGTGKVQRSLINLGRRRVNKRKKAI